MEMIDEKGYDKKSLKDTCYRFVLLLIIIALAIATVCACCKLEVSLLLLVPVISLFGLIYYYIGFDAFCLINYEEFHYYEIDRIHKKITIHVHAKWDDIKYIELSRRYTTVIYKYNKSSNKLETIDSSLLQLFRKYFKKYSKRDDIMLTTLERYRKRKPFEKDW